MPSVLDKYHKPITFIGAAIALMVSMLAIGPCASKDYVSGAIKEVRADVGNQIQKAQDADREFREEMRSEIRDMRKDIRETHEDIRSMLPGKKR
jgi:TolA-binding protein